jgi:DNA repair exonuclease SbcCD ATPase subunit
MKKYLIILIVGASAVACNTKEMEQQIAQLTEENQKLIEESSEKDGSIASFMESFNDIERNLAEIRARENNIAITNSDEKLTDEDIKTKIAEDIAAINELMSQNRDAIASLDKQLKRSYSNNAKIKQAMETLKEEMTAQVAEKDEQIAVLKKDLEDLNFTVAELNASIDTLSIENSNQAQIIGQKVDELNTAYYTVSSKKELVEENVVSSEGGFLGMGKTKTLKDGFNHDAFSRIDITEVKSFPINGKKAELVTNHPEDSYTFEKVDEKTIESLVILDPEKFWNSSKYLVVIVD